MPRHRKIALIGLAIAVGSLLPWGVAHGYNVYLEIAGDLDRTRAPAPIPPAATAKASPQTQEVLDKIAIQFRAERARGPSPTWRWFKWFCSIVHVFAAGGLFLAGGFFLLAMRGQPQTVKPMSVTLFVSVTANVAM